MHLLFPTAIRVELGFCLVTSLRWDSFVSFMSLSLTEARIMYVSSAVMCQTFARLSSWTGLARGPAASCASPLLVANLAPLIQLVILEVRNSACFLVV